MNEYDQLPKGMHKVPDDFSSKKTVKSITHNDLNYTAVIRENLKLLEKKGLIVDVKRMEVIEAEDAATLISFIFEIRSKE